MPSPDTGARIKIERNIGCIFLCIGFEMDVLTGITYDFRCIIGKLFL
jgi:hypothetical protein